MKLERAVELSLQGVISKEKHPDHQRTVELARKYKALITGDDLEFMLQKFDRRESKEDFEQACRIAKQVSPAHTSALMNPARKVGKVRPVVDRIDYGKDNDIRADELKADVQTFYGGRSVDAYLNTLVDPSDADPNAFALLTFDPFDPRFEKPTVYPVRIPCANVYGFEYLNGVLEYLWTAFDIEYVTKAGQIKADGTKEPDEKAKGMRFVMYTSTHHLAFEQVRKDKVSTAKKGLITDDAGNVMTAKNLRPTDSRTEAVYYFKADDERLFEVKLYEQKSGQVPAFRLGCKIDPLTEGRTCVNRWHEALPHLEKNLKHIRELDLSVALHVFPQKHEYITRCMTKGCGGGTFADGTTCPTCKGSGYNTIGTAQDHKTLVMPKAGDPMIDLDKLTHYPELPIDIITKLMEICKEDRADMFRAVYGSDIYGQGNVGKTYEEVLAMNQGMYDALQPFAGWWSESRTTIVNVYASYTDRAEGLNVVHKLPQAFGFETAANVFGMMKAGREAGASKALMSNLNTTALNIAFRDDPQALAKALTQARFDPFPGMTQDIILSLVSGGKTTAESALLWTESATIYAQAESQYTGAVSFYELAETKQREVIKKIVDEMIAEKEANAPEIPAMTGFDPSLDPQNNPDPTTQQ